MEHQYTRTLQTLRHDTQPREYDDLFTVSEALIAHAALQPVLFDAEQPSRLELFNERPNATQAIWKGSEGINEYHHDTLGIHFLRDALIIGVHLREPSEPSRSIVIGSHYGRYSEQPSTRASIYEQTLDIEHILRFTDNFNETVARLGLSRVVQVAREIQRSSGEEQAA